MWGHVCRSRRWEEGQGRCRWEGEEEEMMVSGRCREEKGGEEGRYDCGLQTGG